MRDVAVDMEAGRAVIAAGALVGEVIAEAYKNKAHVGMFCQESRVVAFSRPIS